VIEDACQAHGAEYKGRRVGGIGETGCFSFYPGKNLGAYGEGGAIVTNNPEIDRRVRALRDWGAEKRYHHSLKGYNYRLEGMQGAILRVKLRYLNQWTAYRQTHARDYMRLLEGSAVCVPSVMPYAGHVFHVFALRARDRDGLQQRLQEAGIQTGIHYPFPVHLLEAWSDLGYAAGAFPVSERIAAEELSLPMFPELTPAQIETVASAVRASAGEDPWAR